MCGVYFNKIHSDVTGLFTFHGVKDTVCLVLSPSLALVGLFTITAQARILVIATAGLHTKPIQNTSAIKL